MSPHAPVRATKVAPHASPAPAQPHLLHLSLENSAPDEETAEPVAQLAKQLSTKSEGSNPDPSVATQGKPGLLRKWYARTGLQYSSATQFALQLPLVLVCILVIVSLNMSLIVSGVQTPILLSAISWWANGIILMIPLILVLTHLAAAQYAREVSLSVTKSADCDRQITTWDDKNIIFAKAEGSRLGVTAASLYVLAPLLCVLIFSSLVMNTGSFSSQAGLLSFVGGGILLFYMLTVCSVQVFVRGLLRRERDNTANYVTFTLEPRCLGLIAMQLLLTSYGFLIQLTIPTSPGGNILIPAGTLLSGDFVYPKADECAIYVNQSYIEQYCERGESIELPWEGFGSGLDIACDDGGWGIFDSLYTACRKLAGSSGVQSAVLNNLYAQCFFAMLVIVKEFLASSDPSINLNNFMQKGSKYLRAAIVSAIVVAVCIAPLMADSFFLLRNKDSRAHLLTIGARILGACFLVLSLVLIFVHFLVRKFAMANNTKFFISYKQDDQADAAVGMLYTYLPGKGHWFDKMMSDRSVKGMVDGVANCDVLIAVITKHYFESWFCCLELHTAMKHNKPIQCVFNGHKTTTRETMNLMRKLPELEPLMQIEVLPIHEEIQMIRTCVERITAVCSKKKVIPVFGEGDDRKPVPSRIGKYVDENESNEKLEEKKKQELDAEETKVVHSKEDVRQIPTGAATELESGLVQKVVQDLESRTRSLESKIERLFSRTGAYEFQHNINTY